MLVVAVAFSAAAPPALPLVRVHPSVSSHEVMLLSQEEG
jgi:hypothetical protein